MGAILPSFSNDVLAVQNKTVKANKSLVDLITNTDQKVDIGALLHVLVVQFRNQYVPTRIEALRWLLVLHEKSGESGEWLDAYLQDLLPSLLRNLSDPSDDVVRLNLQVPFCLFLPSLLYVFNLICFYKWDPFFFSHHSFL